MTLTELIAEIYELVRDDHLKANYFKTWINDAILAIATDFHLPALKRLEPFNLPVNAAAWLFDLPECFHKKVFQARNSSWNRITILDSIADLDRKDVDHDETGPAVTHIAVDEMKRKVGVYPKAADTVRLWFYEKPEVLDLDADTLVCIPAQFQRRVVVPRVIMTAYAHLQDMGVDAPHQSLAFWEKEYAKGLYGFPQGEIGMVHYLATLKPLRFHGGSNPLP